MPLLLQVTQFACSSVHVVPVTHSPTTTWADAGHCARHTRLERYLLHTMSAKTDSTPSSLWCAALPTSEQTGGAQHSTIQNKLWCTALPTIQNKLWCTALPTSEQTNKLPLVLTPALEQTHTDVQTKPKVSGELASIPAAEGLYLHWRVSSLPTLWTSGTGCVNPERETHRRNPITTA